MSYKDPITNKIVSTKSKKKLNTKSKKTKSRAWNIVWWIREDLSLWIGKIEEEKSSSCLIKLRDSGEIVEVDNRKIREWNDDDYY